jgi:hypothetical protein
MAWEQIGNIQGPIGPLDLLTDVTAPATTVAGKVLGTTATGQWAPVPDAMLAAYPEATVYDPAVTYNAGDFVLNEGLVWVAYETINPGDSQPPTQANGGDWFYGPISVPSLNDFANSVSDRVTQVDSGLSTARSIASRAVPMDSLGDIPLWSSTVQYIPADVVKVPSPTDVMGYDYFSSDIAQTGGTAPSRDNVATWSLVDGVSLIQNKFIIQRALDDLTDVTAPTDTAAGKVLGTTAVGEWGPVDVPAELPAHTSFDSGKVLTVHLDSIAWMNPPTQALPTLDQLQDVSAPGSTPVGKVLGTTAIGRWAPVDPPSPGWGRWIGTQAEYDAIVTKDPTVLYIVSSVA